jgi:hypothetical protein
MYAGLREGLVDIGLICAERTPTLQHEGHAFEAKVSFCRQGSIYSKTAVWHSQRGRQTPANQS